MPNHRKELLNASVDDLNSLVSRFMETHKDKKGGDTISGNEFMDKENISMELVLLVHRMAVSRGLPKIILDINQ